MTRKTHRSIQHILIVLTGAEQPVRCNDLCNALDERPTVSRIEGMRGKLKRLVAVGLVTEPVSGLVHHLAPADRRLNHLVAGRDRPEGAPLSYPAERGRWL